MLYRDFNWLFIVLLIGGMFLLRRCRWDGCCGIPRLSRRSHIDSANGKSKALEILNIRYAKGEIDTEKYSRKKEEILGK